MNIWKSYTRTVGWRINTLIYLNGIKLSLENLYVNTGAQMLGVEYNYQPFWIIRASHGYSINLLVSHVSQNLLAKSNFWAFLCSYTLEFSTFPPNIPFFHLMVSVSCKISYVLGHIHTLAWFLFIRRGFGRWYIYFFWGGGCKRKSLQILDL